MATNPPDITFRDASNTANVVSLLTYFQSTLGSDFLPVLQGEESSRIKFRIYNNYARNSNVGTAMNVGLTVYDGSGAGSHTAAKSPVFQSWVRVFQTGFGESKGTPGLLTAWYGSDVAIGGSPAGTGVYYPEIGSDGLFTNQIRAGSGYASVGFLELATYVQLPPAVASTSWSFAINVAYEYTT